MACEILWREKGGTLKVSLSQKEPTPIVRGRNYHFIQGYKHTTLCERLGVAFSAYAFSAFFFWTRVWHCSLSKNSDFSLMNSVA